jgi:hypothetical protein
MMKQYTSKEVQLTERREKIALAILQSIIINASAIEYLKAGQIEYDEQVRRIFELADRFIKVSNETV